MATGYTECIAKGASFKEFATKCIRAFGVCNEMRDDPWDAPIPDKLEVSNFHLERIEGATRELTKLKAMSVKQLKEMFKASVADEISEYKEEIKEKKELLKKYQKMLKKAYDFKAPSPQHVEYRSFMIEQITKSIEWDCDVKYYQDAMNTKKKLTFKEWYDEQIRDYEHSIECHTAEYNKEKANKESGSAWLKQVKEAIAKIKN